MKKLPKEDQMKKLPNKIYAKIKNDGLNTYME